MPKACKQGEVSFSVTLPLGGSDASAAGEGFVRQTQVRSLVEPTC
jgi:hypothetical protein